MQRLLTIDEVAALLGMQKATIRKWVSRRRIAVVKFGASMKAAVRIEEREVERLVALYRRPAITLALSHRPMAPLARRRLG